MALEKSVEGVEMATADTADSKIKQFKSITVEKPIPYTFDLGNLLALDTNPLSPLPSEAVLSSTARDGAQSLINQLLTTCPITSSSAGVFLHLPTPTTSIPREKRLPPEKQKTKWELFAAKKGIKPKTKEERKKMVFDEEKGDWVPKWGYKGKNKDGEGDWLVEIDEKKEKAEREGRNVRGEGRRERVERLRRNERKMRANEARGRPKAS
ncbi:MAG: Rhodanese- sulfurtransferase [Geoglossum umbratile]|nr:MAG: Rhodanese- sulfurtransferase [Geoglossum umbratile]